MKTSVALAALLVASLQASVVCGTADAERPALGVRDLLELRSIGGDSGTLSVSPDHLSIAFQIQQADFVAHTYRLAWFVVPVSGGPAVGVGEGGEPILIPSTQGRLLGERADIKPQWSPDGRWIAYLRKDGGEVQVWRSSADGTKQEQLTRNAADVISFSWSADGASIYFEVGRGRQAMRESDEREGETGYLLDDRFMPEISHAPVWYRCEENAWPPQPDSQKCVPTLWVLEADTGAERLATDADRQVYAALAGPAVPAVAAAGRAIKSIARQPDGKRVAWFENEHPVERPGSGAPLTLFMDDSRCGAESCRGMLQRMWWHDDRVVFLRLEGHALGFQALYSWDGRKQSRPRMIYRTDGKVSGCEAMSHFLICLAESAQQPRRIVALDLRNGTVRTIFDPNPQFTRFDTGVVERLEWSDAFGNATRGHLVLPPGYVAGRRYPLVIVQYRSRGFLNGGTGDEYPILPMAARGFAVLSFDCPTDWELVSSLDFKNQFGKSSARTLKDSYERKMDLSALQIIIDRLDRRGIIDRARVGITGLSHGADNVEYALFNSTSFRAAAISGAWTPGFYFYISPSTWERNMLKDLFGASSGTEALENNKASSLVFNTGKVTTPLLIQVSDNELLPTLPAHLALLDAGKPVETYVFPGEYHIKWQPQHKLAAGERAIDWFDFWLNGQEDANPGKAAQYTRWRQLRARLHP